MITKAHGGKLEVSSTPQESTQVTATIPLAAKAN
ncbi:MAG: hypothetical protein DSZ28_05030 [Thiothrix sp.]|nr:MAG: hypothetical protein DSZ28_05030 [Thiothrix sp.]